MTNADGEDCWTDLSGASASGGDVGTASSIVVETIEGVVPLDAQFGAVVPLTVPTALRDVLFGQSAKDQFPLFTYAVLDGARVPGLPEVIETSDLDHACLFQGAAAEEMRDVAPWIVRLEENHSLTRGLFTKGDASWNMWDAEPGIFLRTERSLNDMRRHLRKFTRVQDEDGRWLYWRFWEPKWIIGMIGDLHIDQREEFLTGIARLIAVTSDGRSQAIIR